MTFRFDDISVNTDIRRFEALLEVIFDAQPDTQILLAISPIVFAKYQLPIGHEQRVHPTKLTAMSKLSPYYKGHMCGLPKELLSIRSNPAVTCAGHGLVHVDHRLLNRQAQEMSIVTSCALARATTFIPPYNKYNEDTESVCLEHGITLVRFEDDWRHVVYNPYDPSHDKFYMHPYDRTPDELTRWFDEGLRPNTKSNTQASYSA